MTLMMVEESPTASLRALILARLDELGITVRQAARESNGAISAELMYLIIRGKHSGRLTPDGAEGIATALKLPVSRVWAAAGAPEQQPWDMRRFEALKTWQREIVEQVAWGLLKSGREAAGDDK